MSIELLTIGVLAVAAAIAITVAWRATQHARKAQAALLAMQLEHSAAVERRQRSEPRDDSAAVARDRAPTVHEPAVRLRVLVVEDEPGIREFIQRTLTRDGRDVVSVVGPLAALAALHNSPDISVMLADIVMPEMDGYDLAIEARKIVPGIRVVFMSAFARDSARHPGGDGFLSKPFTRELLLAVVDNALTSR